MQTNKTPIPSFIIGNFLYPTFPVSFGRDTKSRWSLLSGVYARGSKRSHQSALEMCNLSWTPPPTLRDHTSSWTTLEISLKTFVCYPVNMMCSKSNQKSLGSRCVPWLGEGLSMPSPNYPFLCCPLPYRDAPVFVQVVSPPLGWSPLSSFPVIWSPSGGTRGPSVDMPCPGPFHFSHSVHYIYDFCPLPDPDVGPSIFVCDVEHTSFFYFGLCGRKFVLCLF